jgi:hypothetical protein
LRTPLLFPVTLAAMALWCVAATVTIWQGFPASRLMQAILLGTAAYALGVTLFRSRLG